MIEKEEIGKVLQFVSEYWDKLNNDPDNESLKILPSKFWMKSFGGPVGNAEGPKGRWITTLMYTEDPDMDKAFKEVLAVSDNSNNNIGSPFVEGAVIEAKIL